LPYQPVVSTIGGARQVSSYQFTMKPRFAVCIDNSEYPASLELHKIYRVLPDQDAERDGDLRVVDESDEDYLYPAAYFSD
jgi:hypothetical protein